MRKLRLNLSARMIEGSVIAVGLVLATTAVFLLIGRNVLGEGVIALLYLVPIGWSTTRWGQLAGMSAANDPRGPGLFDYEFRIKRRDNGNLRWLRVCARTVFSGSGSGAHPARSHGIR